MSQPKLTKAKRQTAPPQAKTPEPADSIWADGALDASKAAREFGTSEFFWRKLMDAGVLPYSRCGTKKRLMPRRAVLEYLMRNSVPAKSA